MTQLQNMADKFNLSYTQIPCGNSFDGYPVIMHYFSYFGQDMYGTYCTPNFVLIETNGYFTMQNGLDSVYSRSEAASKVRQWCLLMDIEEVSIDE